MGWVQEFQPLQTLFLPVIDAEFRLTAELAHLSECVLVFQLQAEQLVLHVWKINLQPKDNKSKHPHKINKDMKESYIS